MLPKSRDIMPSMKVKKAIAAISDVRQVKMMRFLSCHHNAATDFNDEASKFLRVRPA